MGRFKTTLLAGLLGFATASPVSAADLLKYSYPQQDISEGPSELGSGWYLRADIGASKDHIGQLSPDIATKLSQNGWQATIGAGYKWNNWFRTDLTFGFHNLTDATAVGANVTCPYTLTGLTTQGANQFQVGYLWDAIHDTCSPRQNASLRRQELMLNGYVDLGTWLGVTPYVGAGAGVVTLSTTGSQQFYKTSDNSIYNADLTPTGTYPHLWVDHFGNLITPQPTTPFAKQDLTRRLNQKSFSFAWALMGGLAIDLSSHAKLDLGYRYAHLGNYTSAASPLTGATVTTKMISQEVRIGLRYQID